MTALLRNANLCVDATHPYATEATRNIRAAAGAAGVEYHRLLRPASTLPAGSAVFAAADDAAAYLQGKPGNILPATGAKGAASLCSAGAGAAVPPGAADCGRHHGLRGSGHPAPQHSCDAGALYRRIEYSAVSSVPDRFSCHQGRRRSGRLLPKKARAAEQCGVQLIVLRRPVEQGECAEAILQRCRELL